MDPNLIKRIKLKTSKPFLGKEIKAAIVSDENDAKILRRPPEFEYDFICEIWEGGNPHISVYSYSEVVNEKGLRELALKYQQKRFAVENDQNLSEEELNGWLDLMRKKKVIFVDWGN